MAHIGACVVVGIVVVVVDVVVWEEVVVGGCVDVTVVVVFKKVVVGGWVDVVVSVVVVVTVIKKNIEHLSSFISFL